MFTAAVRPGRVQCARDVAVSAESVRSGWRILMIIVQLIIARVWVVGVGLLAEGVKTLFE